jgi:hypothetical protein
VGNMYGSLLDKGFKIGQNYVFAFRQWSTEQILHE